MSEIVDIVEVVVIIVAIAVNVVVVIVICNCSWCFCLNRCCGRNMEKYRLATGSTGFDFTKQVNCFSSAFAKQLNPNKMNRSSAVQ